jgi:E3 ubiquitin-protein ligase DOA10
MASCRICYEPDNLESLCACRGTVEFVHKKCVEHWIRVSGKPNCELCGAKYNIETVHEQKTKEKESVWYILHILVFTYTAMCLIIMLYWITVKLL